MQFFKRKACLSAVALSLYRAGAISLLALFLVSFPAKAQQTSSLSLSPAVIMAKGSFGQSLTQKLTINNQTPNVFSFQMIAEDVTLHDGKRVFSPAGEAENSIAASAVFSPREIVAPPYTSQSVTVTITIPQATSIRAIVAIFRAKPNVDPKAGSVGLTASMGTLMTFNLSPNVAVSLEPVHVNPSTETTNLSFDDTLTNTGTEPVIPKGVAAILNQNGHLAGKASFAVQRLLPGEKLVYHAEFPDQLKPGDYKVLCTFQFEGHTETQQAQLTVK